MKIKDGLTINKINELELRIKSLENRVEELESTPTNYT